MISCRSIAALSDCALLDAVPMFIARDLPFTDGIFVRGAENKLNTKSWCAERNALYCLYGMRSDDAHRCSFFRIRLPSSYSSQWEARKTARVKEIDPSIWSMKSYEFYCKCTPHTKYVSEKKKSPKNKRAQKLIRSVRVTISLTTTLKRSNRSDDIRCNIDTILTMKRIAWQDSRERRKLRTRMRATRSFFFRSALFSDGWRFKS